MKTIWLCFSAALLLLLTIGCDSVTEVPANRVKSVENSSVSSSIEVFPNELHFVCPSAENQIQEVVLSNTSDTDAYTVDSIVIEAIGESAELLNISTPITLEPGGLITFSVQMSGDNDKRNPGTLKINGDSGPSIPISAVLADVWVEDIDFGEVKIGTSVERNVRIFNNSNETLVIVDLTLEMDEAVFAINYPGALPMTLAPGEHISLKLLYNPIISGSHSGSIVVGFSYSGTELCIDQVGRITAVGV